MKHLLLACLISISYFSFSQTKENPLDFKIDSKVFDKERTISIFLPNAYFKENSTEKFTVAYVFDGQFEPYFSMVSSVMSYYEQTNEGVPMIIVGIHTENRWGEFVPAVKLEKTDMTKNTNQLTELLKSEVIPKVDSMYRTNNINVGIGHSLGGTFLINEVIKQNSIFDAVIAVSPNLRIHNEQILQDAQVFFTDYPENNRFIYTTVGTEGEMEQSFQNSLANLNSIVENANLNNMYWNYDLLQKANHMTTFVQSFDAGYRALSSKLALLDDKLIALAEDETSTIVENLKKYYTELSAFTKEEHKLTTELVLEHSATLGQYDRHKSSNELNQFALQLMETEELSQADKNKLTKRIEDRILHSSFHELTNEAQELAEKNRFKEANELYIRAFDLGLLRATHLVRIESIPTLVQAGNKEEAFKQLDLLANKFKLGGNGNFINDERLLPLRSDKRWEELMSKLEKNAGKYR